MVPRLSLRLIATLAVGLPLLMGAASCRHAGGPRPSGVAEQFWRVQPEAPLRLRNVQVLVLDARNGAPLSDARVMALDSIGAVSGMVVATDTAGVARLQHATGGEIVRLRVIRVGYHPWRDSLHLASQTERAITVQLRHNPSTLIPVPPYLPE